MRGYGSPTYAKRVIMFDCRVLFVDEDEVGLEVAEGPCHLDVGVDGP